jgi:Uma2 family endonuclease
MATTTALITAEEYSRMHFDVPTELVRGEIVFPYGEDGMTRPGFRHGEICSNAAIIIGQWAKGTRLGKVASNDSWVQTSRNPDSVRGADVSYIRTASLPDGVLPDGPSDILPALCVEVLSPSNTVRQMREKADEYQAAGIEEVWVLDPKKSSVVVYRTDSAPRTLNGDEELSSPVLPRFSVRVSEFFQ